MKRADLHVGVLAFQGDFAEHLDVLSSMNVPCTDVRNVRDLDAVTHLILPGGESTVMRSLMASTGIDRAILSRYRAGTLPMFGTCAGAILLARKIKDAKTPHPLGLLNVTIARNAYGTQYDSFSAVLRIQDLSENVPASFIRAPRIVAVGKGVEVLATHESFPVLVRSGNILAATFHTEVRAEKRLHELFLQGRMRGR